MRKNNQRYTHEFKIEAVKLWEASGRRSTEIGKQLGVHPQLLSKWQQVLEGRKTNPARRPITQATGSSSENKADLAAENARLRRENERLKTDHEILKKTVAFIAEITK
jgi:transposase